MVSRMERAMREVDEDGLEITTEVADEGNRDEDEDISSEDEMISDKQNYATPGNAIFKFLLWKYISDFLQIT